MNVYTDHAGTPGNLYPATGGEPALTLSDDDTLVTSLAVTDAQEVDEHTLASGWSY